MVTNSYILPIRPASSPCEVEKQAVIDRRFLFYVCCLDGFSSLAMPLLSGVGVGVAKDGWVGGLDGDFRVVRLRSMRQLRLRDGIRA